MGLVVLVLLVLVVGLVVGLVVRKRRIPIYVITLRNREHTERRRQELARRVRTRFEYIDAVDGKSIERPPDCRLKPGETGCFMSHLKTWATMRARKQKIALVLEDDCKLQLPEQWPVIRALVKQLPNDWEVFNLSPNPNAGERRTIATRDLDRITGDMWGTHCILVHERAFERFGRMWRNEPHPECGNLPFDLWLGKHFVVYAPAKNIQGITPDHDVSDTQG